MFETIKTPSRNKMVMLSLAAGLGLALAGQHVGAQPLV
jgi:hypothetical protein